MYPTTTTDGMDAHVREAYESWLLYTESMERDAAGKIKRILPIVEKQNEEPLDPCGTHRAVLTQPRIEPACVLRHELGK